MSSRSQLGFWLYLNRKKLVAGKVNFIFIGLFLAFLVFLSFEAGFAYARRFYLLLFPYLFLLVTQDIFREEVDSGCLENVLFLRLNFRHYLLAKSIILGFLATIISGAIFLVFLCFSLVMGNAAIPPAISFLRGLAVGFYYSALGGLLGLRLRSGSNVLALVLLQVFFLLAVFVGSTSLSSGRELIDLLISGQAETSRQRLFLLTFVGIWPNAIISRSYSHPVFLAEVLLLLGFYLLLQAAFLRRLELKRQ